VRWRPARSHTVDAEDGHAERDVDGDLVV